MFITVSSVWFSFYDLFVLNKFERTIEEAVLYFKLSKDFLLYIIMYSWSDILLLIKTLLIRRLFESTLDFCGRIRKVKWLNWGKV